MKKYEVQRIDAKEIVDTLIQAVRDFTELHKGLNEDLEPGSEDWFDMQGTVLDAEELILALRKLRHTHGHNFDMIDQGLDARDRAIAITPDEE